MRSAVLGCGLATVVGMIIGSGVFTPANANSIVLTCRVSAAEVARRVSIGISISSENVVYVIIDTSTLTAGEWSTYPGDLHPQSSPANYYRATVTKDAVTWTIPADEDSGPVYRKYDRNTGVLTHYDPEAAVDSVVGRSVSLNCKKS